MTNEARINKISDEYLNVVCPYIIQYEVLANRFPVAILNEIRDIFTHLSKYNTIKDKKEQDTELSRAEGHLIRAKRDCYKFNCMAYEDKYNEFMRLYENIDLSLIKDGTFLPEVLQTHTEALDLLEEAKKMELGVTPEDYSQDYLIYEKYEAAYNKYDDLYKLLKASEITAQTLKTRHIEKEERKTRKEKRNEFLTWFFGITSVIGLILTIVGFIL